MKYNINDSLPYIVLVDFGGTINQVFGAFPSMIDAEKHMKSMAKVYTTFDFKIRDNRDPDQKDLSTIKALVWEN